MAHDRDRVEGAASRVLLLFQKIADLLDPVAVGIQKQQFDIERPMDHQVGPIGLRLVNHQQGADWAEARLFIRGGRGVPGQRGAVVVLKDQAVNGPVREVVVA